jgi:integrase
MAVVRKSRGRYVADFRDQNGRRHIEAPKGEFETLALEKRAAQALLQQRLNEVDSRAYVPVRHRLSFAQVAKKWLASKVRLRASTRSDYETMLDCYLIPYFGHRKYESISRLDVEQFRADMQEGVLDTVRHAREFKLRELQKDNPTAWLEPLEPGPRTINKCLGILTTIGFYASGHNLAMKNVAERIEKLPTGDDDDQGESGVIEENILSPSELGQVIDAAEDPCRVPIALAAYCGLRQAEVLGLQWEDIDWTGGTAEIRRTMRRGVFSKPKSKASRRTIELPPPLIEELERWRQVCPKNEHDVVCPSVTGLLMQASALLQRGFYPALERAGLRRVRYHDLRHSWASNLLEAGANLADVSRDLGHANVFITLKIYTHAIPKSRRGTSDQMAALIAHSAKSGNKMETRGEEVEVLRSADRAQAIVLAERQGWHSTHPCASPLRGGLRPCKTAFLQFCRTLELPGSSSPCLVQKIKKPHKGAFSFSGGETGIRTLEHL